MHTTTSQQALSVEPVLVVFWFWFFLFSQILAKGEILGPAGNQVDIEVRSSKKTGIQGIHNPLPLSWKELSRARGGHLTFQVSSLFSPWSH